MYMCILELPSIISNKDVPTEYNDNGKEELFKENTPLYGMMSWVCNLLMFLYGAAYWMQKGVFPVCCYE